MILRENDIKIDELEVAIMNELQLVDLPLVHRFTKGMYSREMQLKAGTLLTSKIHKTQHLFTISKGKIAISIDAKDWKLLEAPFTGITEPNTRRIGYCIEDCVWTTYHSLKFIHGNEGGYDEEKLRALLEKIEGNILEKRINQISGTDINKEYKKKLDNIKKL